MRQPATLLPAASRAFAVLLLGSLTVTACGDDISGSPSGRVESLTISRTCREIVTGQACNLVAEVFGPSGETVENPLIDWESSDTTVASVGGAGTQATVCGRSRGDVTITATARIGPGQDQVPVTVNLPHLPSTAEC